MYSNRTNRNRYHWERVKVTPFLGTRNLMQVLFFLSSFNAKGSPNSNVPVEILSVAPIVSENGTERSCRGIRIIAAERKSPSPTPHAPTHTQKSYKKFRSRDGWSTLFYQNTGKIQGAPQLPRPHPLNSSLGHSVFRHVLHK